MINDGVIVSGMNSEGDWYPDRYLELNVADVANLGQVAASGNIRIISETVRNRGEVLSGVDLESVRTVIGLAEADRAKHLLDLAARKGSAVRKFAAE